jgi:hypothetical protein
MKKLCSEATGFLNRMKERTGGLVPMRRAQYGLGFDASNPYATTDRYIDTAKAAGTSFLASQTYHQAYYGSKYPNSPGKAQNMAQRAGIISGVLGGVNALSSQYAEQRDYDMMQQRIAEQQAGNYYRVPTDRYGYSEFATNQFNNTAYKMGGRVRKYQEGGAVDAEEVEDEQVTFDSTFSPEQRYSPEYESEDVLPLDQEGYTDLSRVRPTLGNVPLRLGMNDGDVAQTINSIAMKESGGDYSVVNTSGGSKAIYATGKYQFVPKYWAPQIAKFQGTEGKSQEETMEMFRKSPQVQDAFMRHVVTDIYLPEVKKLLPMASRYGIGQDALIKMLHYRGIQDTKRRLQTGDFEVSESEKKAYNNPDILKYIGNG